MSEWWTYRPSDFLMFAPRTYWRLFELHNQALWPAPLALLAAGTLGWLWLARRGVTALRAGFAALAAAWAFVGIAFLLQRFEPIQGVAGGFAAAFVLQALLLVVLFGWPHGLAAAEGGRRLAGLSLLAAALWLHPLLAPAAGRPWAQAEVAGLAPDPTAIATLGLLLCATGVTRGARGWLSAAAVLPAAWCVVSAATLATMGSAQAAVPAGALLLPLAALIATRAGAPR